MASFHIAAKAGAGGQGGAHADYIERAGKYKTRDRDDLAFSETLNLPEWASNAHEFWEQSDRLERANAAGYREYEIALPREMTSEQRLDLVRDFVATEIGTQHVCTYAIHCPRAALEGGEQPHAHIMFSERTHDAVERKTPEHYFKRANLKEPERGGCKKARGEPKMVATRKAELVALRERFAALQNKHLEKLDLPDRVTHLSLKAQGIERAPEEHLGPKRIAAKTPEVARVLAARQDRTLSVLLEQSIRIAERRLHRLVSLRMARGAAALKALMTKTPTDLFREAGGARSERDDAGVNHQVEQPAPAAASRMSRFGQAASLATQAKLATEVKEAEAKLAAEAKEAAIKKAEHRKAKAKAREAKVRAATERAIPPKAMNLPPAAPAQPAAPATARADGVVIGAKVTKKYYDDLLVRLDGLRPGKVEWIVSIARSEQVYEGPIVYITDTHIGQRTGDLSVVLHDISKLDNAVWINKLINNQKITTRDKIVVTYDKTQGQLVQPPRNLAPPPPQPRQRDPQIDREIDRPR